MPDFDPTAAGFEATLDHAMSLIGDDDDDEGSSAPLLSGGNDDEDPPETAPAEPASDDDADPDKTEDADAVEPAATPAIEAPATFSDEFKAKFAKLPPDLQRDLAQWETERNRGVSQKLEEAATQRKALEAQTSAAATERQQLAQQLDTAVQLAQQFNPVIAAGLRMSQDDWLALARNDKAAYIERRAEFDAEIGKVNWALQQRDALQRQQHGETVQQQMEQLQRVMPELVDPATKKLDVAKTQSFAREVDTHLKSAGFTAAEISGVTDHRMLLVVRDAIAYRTAQAQRAAAASKATKPGPARTVKPGSGDSGARSAQQAAALKSFRNASSTADQADALMRAFNL